MNPSQNGEIIVVKVGGSTLGEGDSTSPDLIELAQRGMRPVVVHGGGAVISQWARRQGIQPEFVRGLRKTDAETLNVAIAVLCGLINAQIVAELSGLGGNAVGISGLSGGLIQAEVLDPELGLVGRIVEVNPAPIHTALEVGAIPVIAPAALNVSPLDENARILNVNADSSAGEIARAIGASRIVFQTDVPGALDANRRLIPRMTRGQARDLIASGIAFGGMIPKLEACVSALDTVGTGHIIDGRVQGALLECVDGGDVGTRIV